MTCPSSILDRESDDNKTTFEFSWTASGSDNVDSSVSVSCSETSPHAFPVGTTAVTCSGSDVAGNVGSCNFTVHVRDHEAPNVTSCPSNVDVSAESGSACRTVTWGSVSAVDKNDIPMVVPSAESSPSSGLSNGSSFCFGVTTVSYNFSEAVTGLWSLCYFDVQITDTEAPSVTCPSDVSGSTDSGSASLNYSWSASASDVIDSSASVSCNPSSPHLFGVGSHVVSCESVDASGNRGNCSFSVTVSGMCVMVLLGVVGMCGVVTVCWDRH